MSETFLNGTEMHKQITTTKTQINTMLKHRQNSVFNRYPFVFNEVTFTNFTDTLKNETFPGNNYYAPYIQGKYDKVDLTWKLDTGTPLTYTNWDNQEPSNVNNRRKIKFIEKKWLTSYYYMKRPIICSYRL